tara:strand:+ start:1322 stop:1735 length:414 start_codon:yes stop_codon:yes gene_type:complete
MANFGVNDLVITKDIDGMVSSAAYPITNDLIENYGSPIMTLDGVEQQTGGAHPSLAAILNNLAVPVGLLYMQQSFKTNVSPSVTIDAAHANAKASGVAPNALFDKLLNLAEINKKSTQQTRKRNKKVNRKTRKSVIT